MVDRVADQLQQVRFDLAGGPAVNGAYRGGDPAQSRQQHPGHADHPPSTLFGGQANEFLEDGVLEVAGRRGMLEEGTQLDQGDPTGR